MKREFRPAPSAAMFVLLAAGAAAAEPTYQLDIPAQPVGEALKRFAEQSRMQVVYYSNVPGGRIARQVVGTLPVGAALEQLLDGTGLTFQAVDESTVAILDPESSSREPRSVPAGEGRSTRISQLDHTGSGAAQRRIRLAQAAPRDAAAFAAGSQEPIRIEEIIVTAQMREERLLDVPMSISVLSDDLMVEQRIVNLLDVARVVPGLVVNDAGPGRRRIALRGVGNTFGAQPLVGLYLDETSVAGFNDAVIDLQTYDLERVEVLRGPQGTLYGEGSTSGTIRFITHKPELDRFELAANMKVLSIEDGDFGLDYDAALNVPLIEDELALRISGRYFEGGGWIDQPLVGREDINDQGLLDMRTQLRWQPSENFTADALAVIHRNDAGAANRGEDADGNYTQAFLEDTTPSAQDEFDIFNLTLSYDLGPVSLISASSYIEIRKQLRQDGNTIPLVAPPVPPFQFLSMEQDSDGRSFSQELRVSSNPGARLAYTVGGYYRDSQLDRFSNSRFGLDAATASAFNQISDNGSQAWSAFGDAVYRLTERFELGTGLRYFVDERTNFDGVAERDARFKSVTPRFYARYAFSDTLSLYGNVAKGFRSGGFNVAGQPEYDPETLWSYELGVKLAAPELRLNAEATVFYSDYQNVQVVGVTGTSLGRSITSNLGEAWIKGIEGSVGFTALMGLTLGASGSVYRTEVTELNVANGSHGIGDPLDNVPEYAVSAWLDYERALSAATTGSVQLNYGRRGVSDYRNRSVGPFFFSQSDIVDLLNVSCGFERARWRVSVFVDNVLNERGYLDAFSIEGSAARPQPRTFGISASVVL